MATQQTNNLLAVLGADPNRAFGGGLQRCELTPGQVLYKAEGPIDRVYFPDSGLISLVAVTSSGQTVETAVVGREGGVGLAEAAGSRHSFCLTTVEAGGQALWASADAFCDVLDNNPDFRRRVAKYTELIIAEAKQLIACTALYKVEQRLAWWLLDCQDRLGPEVVELPLTQEFLAGMLGVSRTTVTMIAGELAERGLIVTRRGRVIITDREGLERAAGECFGRVREFRAIIEGSTLEERARAADA